MKTPILILLFILTGGCIFAQVDSTAVQQILQTGVAIADATNNTIIKGVPNSVTGGLITLVAGFIIRYFEKRRLRKQGKLSD